MNEPDHWDELDSLVKLSAIGDFIESLSNVYIYVGDAVRWDFLVSGIAESGIVMKTVAASTSSAPSFASLLTGLSPSSHGVHSFGERIPNSVETIHDIPGVSTAFVNSIQADSTADDPIYDIQRIEPLQDPFSFEDISQPFVVMERGPGGHAPYDSTGDADATYFQKISDCSPAELRDQYRTKVEIDRQRFRRRIDKLDDLGLLQDTLVVYTSDHGELLGEGGLLGHSGPMCPELVYVPTVFINPDNIQGVVRDSVFRHVDVLPTVCNVVGRDLFISGLDGTALSDRSPSDPGLSITKARYGKSSPVSGELFYEGVWDRSGGNVFTRSSLTERLKVLCGKLLKSPKRSYMRRHVLSGLRSYFVTNPTYGDCRPRSEAAKFLPDDYQQASMNQIGENELDTLRNLGYLE